MRVSTALLTTAVATAAAIFLSACSGSPPSNVLVPTVAGDSHPSLIQSNAGQRGTHVLYVNDDDYPYAVAVLKYRTWKHSGSITKAVLYPTGNWVDKDGNLYVANDSYEKGPKDRLHGVPNITEYNSARGVIFKYSAGMEDPTAVTTDKFGKVYEADSHGFVSEYPPQTNSPAVTCSVNGAVEGVAVDKTHDVFADYQTTSGGSVIEYPRGLSRSHCTGTVLPISFGGAGGIATDKQGNLVVCDVTASAVDIIAPPYANITAQLGSGWTHPTNISIDRAGTQAYIIEAGYLSDVAVVSYPEGAAIATLSGQNGLPNPISAVDSENYVP